MKAAYYILRHKTDKRVLCNDGLRRSNAGSIEAIKKYKSLGHAQRRARTFFKIIHVYDDESLDCCGVITRKDGTKR